MRALWLALVTIAVATSCKLECSNVPAVRYEPLVLPVRVEDEDKLNECKRDLEYWKDLSAYYRDQYCSDKFDTY
jgi:hypothetical protein